MNQTLTGLEETIQELRSLREFKAEAEKIVTDYKAEASRLRLEVRDLKSKNAVLQRAPCVLDGLDEDFLFSQQATVQFVRRGGQGRRLKITRTSGKSVIKISDSEQEGLLQGAVDEASGRQRTRPKK